MISLDCCPLAEFMLFSGKSSKYSVGARSQQKFLNSSTVNPGSARAVRCTQVFSDIFVKLHLNSFANVYLTTVKNVNYIYRSQTKFAKVMLLHLSVSHSVHRGRGVCLWI